MGERYVFTPPIILSDLLLKERIELLMFILDLMLFNNSRPFFYDDHFKFICSKFQNPAAVLIYQDHDHFQHHIHYSNEEYRRYDHGK